MILTIVLTLVFVVLIFLLIFLYLPIEVVIKTASNEYYLQLKGIAKVVLEPDKDFIICLRLQTFFKEFCFYPLTKVSSSKKAKVTQGGCKSKRSKKLENKKKSLIRVLQSFKVKNVFVDLDSGDCILNAYLYPLFVLMNNKIGNFYLNFQGRNKVELMLQNRPINIINSLIKL